MFAENEVVDITASNGVASNEIKHLFPVQSANGNVVYLDERVTDANSNSTFDSYIAHNLVDNSVDFFPGDVGMMSSNHDGSAYSFTGISETLVSNSDDLADIFTLINGVVAAVPELATGGQLDASVEQLKSYGVYNSEVGSTSVGHFFFVTTASNVSTSATYSGTDSRLFKFDASDKSSTLVKDDFHDIEVIEVTDTGSFLLLKTTRDLTSIGDTTSQKLFVLNSSTGAFQRIDTNGVQYVHHAFMSDDGKRVAFSYSNSPSFYSSGTGLGIVNRESLERVALGLIPKYVLSTFELLDISADGSQILLLGEANIRASQYYSYLATYNIDTYEYNLVGFSPQLELLSFFNADYRNYPHQAHFSRDGRYVSFLTRPKGRDNNRVYLADLNVLDAMSVPSQPTGLAVSNDKIGRIELTWTEPSEESLHIYQVYRYPTNNPESIKLVATPTSSEYVDTASELQPGVDYTYIVQACNQVFRCNEASIAGGGVVLPPKVTNLQVKDSAVDIYHANMSWDPIYADEGGSVSYKLVVKNGDSSRTLYFTTQNALYDVYIGRRSEDVLLFRLTACINSRCGEPSDDLVIDFQVGDINHVKQFVNDDFSQLQLSWSPARNASGYKVYRSEDNQGFKFLQQTNEPEFLDTTIDFDKASISYRIDACNFYNVCDGQVSFYAPSMLSMQSLDRPSVYVTELADAYQLDIQSIERYESVKIYRRQQAFGTAQLITTISAGFDDTDETFVDTDVLPGRNYFYYIEGCVNDTCEVSRDVKADKLEHYYYSLQKVSNFTASYNLYEDKVLLQWSGSSHFDLLVFQRSRLGSGIWSSIGFHNDSSINEYRDYEAKAGRYYQYRMRGEKDGKGTQWVYHDDVALRSYNSGVFDLLSAPKVSTYDSRYSDQIRLEWNSVQRANYYEVFESSAEQGDFIKVSSSSSRNYTKRELRPGQSYFYKVRACFSDGAYCSDFSNIVNGKTIGNAVTIPAAITQAPTLSWDDQYNIRASWDKVDNAYYQVLKSYSSNSSYSNPLSTHSHDGVVISSYYSTTYVKVRACNALGCSEYSPVSSLERGQSSGNSKTSYKIDKLSLSQPSTMEVRVVREQTGEMRPNLLMVYYSKTLTGQKLRWAADRSPSYSFNTTLDVKDGEEYFVWLQSCYADGCMFDEQYHHIVIDSEANSLSVPDISTITAKVTGLNRINVENGWMPAGVRLEIHQAPSSSSNKQYIGAENYSFSTSNFNVYSLNLNDYQSTATGLYYRYCLRSDYSVCSEFSAAEIVTFPPKFTSEIKWDPTIRLWNYRYVLDSENRIARRASYDSHHRSEQSLWLNNGFDLSFKVFIPLVTSDRCLLYKQQFVENVELTLFEFINGSNCGDASLSNQLYLRVAEDTSRVVSIPNEYRGREVQVDVDVNASGIMMISLDGMRFIRYDVSTIKQMLGSFSPIQQVFNENYGWSNQLEVYNFVVKSKTSVPTSLPVKDDYYLNLADSNPLSATAYFNTNPQRKVKVLWVKLGESDYLHEIVATTEYNFSDTRIEYSGPTITEDATYFVSTATCNNSGCADVSSDSDFIRAVQIDTPRLYTANKTNNADEALLDWSGVADAERYELMISNINGWETEHFALLLSTEESQALVANIPVAANDEFYFRVRACIGEYCSGLSNTRSVIPERDSDGDGLTNSEEEEIGSNPYVVDTDGDGLTDAEENELGTSPLFADTDGDGIGDAEEVLAGTDPRFNPQLCPNNMCNAFSHSWRLKIYVDFVNSRK
ncbi:MAG: fibronectin type III domain-containing protein [Aestuariibacter sp.]